MNINNILFPVDFSEGSRALNREVEWVANHFGSDVTLMHVFEIPFTWYGTGEAPLMSADCFQHLAEDAKKRLEEYPLQVPTNRLNRIITKGDAAWSIKNWVEEHPVDLIMMGTHGYGSLRRALLGSVAMKLLHDVSCPVWTHSCNERGLSFSTRISNVLCALDVTQEAVPLLRFVRDFAQDCGASVRVIHAVPEMETRPSRYLDMDLHKYLKGWAAKDIEQSQHDAGTNFPVRITDGFIAQDAALLAAEEDVDLIVTGRGKAQDVFGTFRTHTYDIIRKAPCPVLSYCAPVVQPVTAQEEKIGDAVFA